MSADGLRVATVAVGGLALVGISLLVLPIIWFVGRPALDSVRARPIETGCDSGLAGPGAIVAFDAATGTAEWTALVGHSHVADTAPGVIELESDLSNSVPLETVRRTFDIASMQVTACRQEPVPAAVEEAADQRRNAVDLAWEFDHTADVSIQITNEYHQSTVDAYRDQDLLWSTVFPIDGWSAEAASGTEETVIVVTGTRVTLLDVTTGETIWTTDYDSPGQGGFFNYYNEPGAYRQFWYDSDADMYIGLVRANAPYRD